MLDCMPVDIEDLDSLGDFDVPSYSKHLAKNGFRENLPGATGTTSVDRFEHRYLCNRSTVATQPLRFCKA